MALSGVSILPVSRKYWGLTREATSAHPWCLCTTRWMEIYSRGFRRSLRRSQGQFLQHLNVTAHFDQRPHRKVHIKAAIWTNVLCEGSPEKWKQYGSVYFMPLKVVLQSTSPKPIGRSCRLQIEAGIVAVPLPQNFFPGKPYFLFLKPSADWTGPTYIIECNFFYLKPTDCVFLLAKFKVSSQKV